MHDVDTQEERDGVVAVADVRVDQFLRTTRKYCTNASRALEGGCSDVTDEEHGERLAEHRIEEVLCVLAAHDEEVLQEEELATTVVEQRKLLRAEEHLERELQKPNK